MGNKKNAKRANAAKKAPKRGSRKAKPSPTEAPKKKRASPRLAKVDMDASEDDTSKKTRRSTGKEKESNEKNATMEQEVESETEPPSKKEKADDSPQNDAKKKSPHKHHHHHHHHHEHHLNEETLKRLKDYLSSERLNEGLDEDAIALKILRTEKQTLERVKFLHGPYVDSDDENDSDSAQQTQSYQAAEEYTIALEFYKRIVAEVQSENPDKKLDLKTLNWLRRALGLHRRAELLAATVETREEEEREGETDESEDEGNGSQADKKKRTATRGRSSRIKKKAARRTKESMNLNALTSAVDDLEKELGPFTVSASASRTTELLITSSICAYCFFPLTITEEAQEGQGCLSTRGKCESAKSRASCKGKDGEASEAQGKEEGYLRPYFDCSHS